VSFLRATLWLWLAAHLFERIYSLLNWRVSREHLT
jgi:hypothetical protein